MSEFLTQAQLAERLVAKTGVSLETAKKFSTLFFKIVKTGLKESESFAIYNFGTFKKTWIETTSALNPQTGEKIQVPAHWRIKFVPCASVARRINKPYAKLKPKLYRETKVKTEEPDDENAGLLAAAETYRAQQEAEKAAEEEIRPEDIVDENDDYDDLEDSSEKKPIKLFALIGLGILILILLITLLLRSCSGKSKKEAAEPVTQIETVVEEETPVNPEPQPVEEINETPKIEPEPQPEPKVVPLPVDSAPEEIYNVPAGSNYHTIAELKYKNKHLWPVLYAANKDKYPDPDVIGMRGNITIPPLPTQEDKASNMISAAIVDAYDGYVSMIKEQPDSGKNTIRTNRAIRVIVSGELLQKGFIQANASHFQKDHVERAQTIIATYYR